MKGVAVHVEDYVSDIMSHLIAQEEHEGCRTRKSPICEAELLEITHQETQWQSPAFTQDSMT
jgi:hypothetical protein